MNEIASHVPTTTRRYRAAGLLALAVPVIGAIVSNLADTLFTPLVVILAIGVLAIVGRVLASTTSRFVVSVESFGSAYRGAPSGAIHVYEHRWLTRTKRWVVPLLGSTPPELEIFPSSLGLRFDNGDPEAGGRGAPLRVSSLLELAGAEALLLERGAAPLEAAVEPSQWGTPVAMATGLGFTDVARRLQASGSVGQ